MFLFTHVMFVGSFQIVMTLFHLYKVLDPYILFHCLYKIQKNKLSNWMLLICSIYNNALSTCLSMHNIHIYYTYTEYKAKPHPISCLYMHCKFGVHIIIPYAHIFECATVTRITLCKQQFRIHDLGHVKYMCPNYNVLYVTILWERSV